ncbi:NUDIX hydrolase [Halorussus amylolyticus]|uniref:NUDIX hydrolase n=1 Tax=Halorussus amylolyticus TaxID=1126242 RepID=UPI001052AC18|nr:NUDIX domain-containing protein [Halorussus amylolyticus]
MSLTKRSRRRVADAIDRLETEYGAFEVVEKTWDHPPEAYESVADRFDAGTHGGAGAWVRNDAGEALLVRHEGATAWSDPGGKHEPGETLEDTARREVREEAGVEVELTGIRQAHRIAVRGPRDERPRIYRLIIIFDAEYVSGDVRPREGEIAEAKWWDRHPDDLLYPDLAEFPISAGE